MNRIGTPELEPRVTVLDRTLLRATSVDWLKAAYVAIVLVSLFTRLFDVGSRVVSHDESLHTQYSYQYYNGDGYQHSALMHGPSLFHITALSYWLFGPSDASSRIPVALVGTILVVLPYFLRRWIGSLGAVIASLLLLISPYITYYSRYIRHDIYIITAAAITFIALVHYLDQRKDKYLWWFALGMALMFTTMETSFIYVAIFGSFIAVRLGAKILSAQWFPAIIPRVRLPLLLIALAALMLVAGRLGQRQAQRALAETTPTTTATAEEGFAADPDQALTAGAAAAEEATTVTVMRWVQLAGVIVLAGGLFLAAYRMRSELEDLAEFDLVVLFTTLTLPTATAFLVVLVGRDPLDYTLSTCQLAGQETMSAGQLFFARLLNATCRSAFLSSGVVFTGFFLVATLTVSILVGLWWNRRRWIIAAAIFHGIFLLLFTSLFSNPSGWASGMIGSLGYWLAQQEVQRANQRWFFYFFVLPFYEFLPIILTFLSAHLWAKKHRLSKIIGYWIAVIVVGLLTYSLTNWLFDRSVLDPALRSKVPGLVAAAIVLAAAIIYWFFVRRRQIRTELGFDGGWRWTGLIGVDDLFGFVPYLIWWFLASWLIYSLAGEKMAWLSTHFILPMALMGGWYINERFLTANRREILTGRFAALVAMIALLVAAAFVTVTPLVLGQISLGGQEAANLRGIGRFLGGLIVVAGLIYVIWRYGASFDRGTVKRAWLVGLLLPLALLTVRFTYMSSFPNADYVTEYLVYAHGAPATKSEVLSQLEQLSVRMHGDKSIKVAYDNDTSWPYTWYLRDYPNRIYFGENPGPNITEAPVILVGSLNWDKVEPLLRNDYETHTYTFLWWPMEEYRKFSWNAVFGDPNVEPEFRRGLGDPGVRQALWNIFFYRDYQKYGEVFGGNYAIGQWPLRHDLRMYIRKDSLATIWDQGVNILEAEPAVDPYELNEYSLLPSLVIDGAGSAQGPLLQPRNMAIGPDDLVYVADSGNHRVQVFDQQGQFVRGWGTFGLEPGQFNEPWGLAVDQDYVYVADTWNHRLQKFTLEGDLVTVIGESGSPSGDDEGGGLFFGPRDVLIMPDGNLLVTDTGNHRLQLLSPDGTFLAAVGGQGAQLGQFYEPVGISLASDGSVYVADTWNGRIQHLSADLLPLGQWPVEAWFGQSIYNKPYLAADELGRVYTTDPEGYRVLVFDSSGQYVGRFGQYGTGSGQFGLPNGIAVGTKGDIYVADAGNSRIVRYDPLPLGPPESQENPPPDSGG